MSDKDQAQSIFLNSLKITDQDERNAYVQARCQGSSSSRLRREIEELLGHADRLGRFMEGESADPAATELSLGIAHQKGGIHRDWKPGKLLVALYDGQPVPKVIDFGVAKAISQRLTEKTMFTGLGQIIGTLEYMSPEQTQRNQLDIDTRSDVYSLGVVLYELLTGDTPFDRQRLRSAAFDETLRIIREEEPLRPSTKVSFSKTLRSVATTRRIESAKLSQLIRGELDWIVMKTLEKDRARRYESASALAADLEHFLKNEPVADRGRDGHCWPPPAQIGTCGTTAYGSSLGK